MVFIEIFTKLVVFLDLKDLKKIRQGKLTGGSTKIGNSRDDGASVTRLVLEKRKNASYIIGKIVPKKICWGVRARGFFLA